MDLWIIHRIAFLSAKNATTNFTTGTNLNRFAKKRIFHAKAGAKGGKRADLNNQYFRSAWESNFARILNVMKDRGEVYSWKFENREFSFPVKRGTRFYKPDFEVIYEEGGVAKYVEVKGLMMAKDVTTLTRMARYYPEVEILILGKKEYQEFESEFGHLEHWEK